MGGVRRRGLQGEPDDPLNILVPDRARRARAGFVEQAVETALAIRMSEALLEEGVFVTGFGYPVVPQGQARVRCQVSAGHTREQLEQAVAAFKKVGKRLGVI